MNIILSNSSGKPIYEQIMTQMKQMIVSGELRPGDPLPSMRLLAKELRISVITTKRAYEELEAEDFVYSIAGKGTFVAAAPSELVREEKRRQVQELLKKAASAARENGIEKEELAQMLSVICQEGS